MCHTWNNAVIFPRHVEGKKLDRTVWNLSTFHAYVSYHVKVRFLQIAPTFYFVTCSSFTYFGMSNNKHRHTLTEKITYFSFMHNTQSPCCNMHEQGKFFWPLLPKMYKIRVLVWKKKKSKVFTGLLHQDFNMQHCPLIVILFL